MKKIIVAIFLLLAAPVFAQDYITNLDTEEGNTKLNEELRKYRNDIRDIKSSVSNIDTSALVPSGGIIMWSGSTASIPSGFVLCDGTNGTPDLRNKFIVGAGSTYAVAATGGATTHTHVASVPDSGAHTHGVPANNYTAPGAGGTAMMVGANTYSSTHSHASVTVDSPNHLPPYYALAYIMKT